MPEMEFLEVLDTIQAEHASTMRVFKGDGTPIRHVNQRNTPEYKRRLMEAARLIGDVSTGRKPMYLLQEVMTTSDFPLFTADILDRTIMGAYRAYPKIWPKYLGSRTVRDFRQAKLFAFDGLEAYLSPILPEMTEYPAAAMAESRYTLQVQKYGRRVPFTWELFLADDLDFLGTIPTRLGNAAVRSEDRFATDLWTDANGPDATFFSAAHVNLLTGADSALSTASLQTALSMLASQLDVDGEPIIFDGFTLVVPPALGPRANIITNAVEYRYVVGSNTTIVQGNGISQNLTVAVNPYIAKIVTAGTIASTMWAVFGNPMDGRPAATMALLRGYEEPQIFMKEPNQRRIGGANNPFDGDFATDAIEYKLRHSFGGSLLEYRSAIASMGQ